MFWLIMSTQLLAGDFQAVTTETKSAIIDWTDYKLKCTADANPGAGKNGFAELEALARKKLGPKFLDSTDTIIVEAGITIKSLIDEDTALGQHLASNTSTWYVTEARYHISGPVELDAELDIVEWLRPYIVSRSFEGKPETNGYKSDYSGFLIDARGLGAQGAVAPKILSNTGEELYNLSKIALKAARKVTPIQYVADPADPKVIKRVGENPLILVASKVNNGVNIVLDENTSVLFKKEAQDPDLLAKASIVLVLDP